MNTKLENKLAAMTMGEVAQHLLDSVYEELGYNDPDPKQHRTDSRLEEQAIRDNIRKFIPRNLLASYGLRMRHVGIDRNDVSIDFELRPRHPFYFERLPWQKRSISVYLFTIRRKKMVLGDGVSKDLVITKLEIEGDDNTPNTPMLDVILRSVNFHLAGHHKMREAADRLQSIADTYGESALQQILEDVYTVKNFTSEYRVSPDTVAVLCNTKNERLHRMAEAVQNGRPAPVGLEEYCKNYAAENAK